MQYSFYLLGIEVQETIDCENLPPPVPKPSFGVMKELTAKKTDVFVFDLETTSLSKNNVASNIKNSLVLLFSKCNPHFHDCLR